MFAATTVAQPTSRKFSARKFAPILAGVAVGALLMTFVDPAFAQATSGSSTVFTNLQNKASDLYYNVRSIILIVCALAIVGIMASAISGRFPFGKAIAIVGAIVAIGLSSEIVTYFATASSSSTGTNANGWQQLTDTAQSP